MKKLILILLPTAFSLPLFFDSCISNRSRKPKEELTTILCAFSWANNNITPTKAARIITLRDTVINDNIKTYLDTVYLIPVPKYDSINKKDTTLLYFVKSKAVIFDFNKASY